MSNKPKRAEIRDVVQKTIKPHIGSLGIVRDIDSEGVKCLAIRPKIGDQPADEFTLKHGDYAVIGQAAVYFPKDPPTQRTSFFNNAKVKRPAIVDEVAANMPVTPVAPRQPGQPAAQPASQPAATMPELPPQPPRREGIGAIGGIIATNQSTMPKPRRRPFQPPDPSHGL